MGILEPNPTVKFTSSALELVKELEKELGLDAMDAVANERKVPAPNVEYRIPVPKVSQKPKQKYDLLAILGVDVLS